MSFCSLIGQCSRASGSEKCIYCGKSVGSKALESAYEKALKSTSKKAVFTGWTCIAGPSDLVHFLVNNGKTVTYQVFARNVDLSTADLDKTQKRLLRTDYHVTFLKTKLPSGKLAWVLQHSHIEQLFLPPGTRFDPEEEASLIP